MWTRVASVEMKRDVFLKPTVEKKYCWKDISQEYLTLYSNVHERIYAFDKTSCEKVGKKFRMLNLDSQSKLTACTI